MRRIFASVVVAFVCAAPLHAQTSVYSPLSRWQDPLASWETSLMRFEASARPQSSRPELPGLRPRSVELLQDALLRKHPKLLGNDARIARHMIVDKFFGKGSEQSKINGRNLLNGAMAEALFHDKNPEWRYVSKPNASQHDVYRSETGKRPPLNGQVKFHASGRADIYARDMMKDHRAHRFFVPDDHVQSVRDYWLQEYKVATARGDAVAAKQAARNAGRVQPLGATADEVVRATKQAAQYAAAEATARYVSLAGAAALSLGHTWWDYARGEISGDQAAYRLTKAASLIGTGLAADQLLLLVQDGALRGTLKGSLIVGAIVFLADTSWSIYEHGGLAAFRHPEFYEQVAGSVSAITIGGWAGFYSATAATAAASALGPFAPIIGLASGFIFGTGAGVVASVGGRAATGWLLRSIWPEWYQRYEAQQFAAAKEAIERRIKEAQQIP